jgi:hypothetical protein
LPDWLKRCRRHAGAVAKGGGRWLQGCDPAWLRVRRRFRRPPPGPVLLLCVYRAKNARRVVDLVSQARRLDAEIHLWALDAAADALAPWTRGCGAGVRMELLNRLWRRAGDSPRRQIVISDDDIVFTRGDLRSLLAACEQCGFDIAQPAHAIGSYAGRHFPRSRAFTIARLTSWVDVGPMVVISADWFDRVLPFPDRAGMGWGLGLVWGQLRHSGCRLGIVDGICVRHLYPPMLEYDTAPESLRVSEILHKLDLRSTTEAQQCFARWMFWQPAPPWQAR